MIVTIDGPAAAGKSTAARGLAKRLGFDYLDTGVFYRAATWKAFALGVSLDDLDALACVSEHVTVEFMERDGQRRVLCDGEDITEEIRTPEVTSSVWRLADDPTVRSALVEQQRRFARGRDLVTEGRDQGTEVWPEAEVKFYLDASLEERARRRLRDIRAMGRAASWHEIRTEIAERDRLDRARPVGRLRREDDMIVIDNSELTAEEVVTRMVQEVVRRRGRFARAASGECEG